jgi:hypothetical protein
VLLTGARGRAGGLALGCRAAAARLEWARGIQTMSMIRNVLLGSLAALAAANLVSAPATARRQQKPNIVIIRGDDIGQSNLSA